MDKDFKVETKFKVGDRVRAVWYNTPNLLQPATIIGVFEDGNYGVNFDHFTYNPEDFHHKSYRELSHLKVKATKIAKKVHKNNIIKEENGWLYLKN